jgi:putative hydrolase of HD superfamily
MTSEQQLSASESAVQLPAELQFVLELDALKDLERHNPLSTGERRERVAEHSWHLAMAAILLQEFAADDVDVARAALLAVVHDVVEHFVGDTFAFGTDTTDQDSREQTAMKQLRASSDSKAIQLLVDYWEEYEYQTTATARFVKGLDALLPIAHNYSNPEQSSWIKHGVSADKVRHRLDTHGEVGKLRGVGEEMIQSAHKQGFLT